jgi:predicted cupin superfamily sugar epimerase
VTELPDWARRLQLSPHPEGGWFRETWRSNLTIGQSALPAEYAGPRSVGTAILFLLMPGQQSAWHAVRSAELWFFHRGGPLMLEMGRQRSTTTTYVIGADVNGAQHPQLVVPPGYWQRARPRDDEPALVSCVVAPGFDFADFAIHTNLSTGDGSCSDARSLTNDATSSRATINSVPTNPTVADQPPTL